MQPFGIKAEHIQDTLQHADIVQRLEFGELGINLYMKTIDGQSPPSSLIVLERLLKNEEPVIDSVYRTYLPPLGLKRDTKPFEVIKLIADKFGVTLTILGKTGKFFDKVVMPIPPGTRQSDILGIKEKCSFATGFYIRVRENAFLEIAFAFALNTEKYRKWLSEQCRI